MKLTKIRHPSQAAPVIQDGPVTLAESNACAEYILTKYGNGKLTVPPTSANYADYLYWFNFGNGSLQPATSVNMMIRFANLPPDNFVAGMVRGRLSKSLRMIEERLKGSTWLAGEEFTAADIMCVCSFTTMRLFAPFELGEYPKILAYLKRVGEREGYKRAMQKGDPDLKPLLGPEAPEPLQVGA